MAGQGATGNTRTAFADLGRMLLFPYANSLTDAMAPLLRDQRIISPLISQEELYA